MLFLHPPTTADEVRAFCEKFNENIRVEYKSDLDASVRRVVPKVLSSFANSLGGVLVIGVNAQNGVPRGPIQGFVTPDEELPLTIENICLQNINPPIIPVVHLVPSDVIGRSFLVIEVDESWEAPHAIENSTRVYVRTGNAADPYELAKVDLIIELVRRRSDPAEKRERLIARARTKSQSVVQQEVVNVEVSVAPTYPRRTLCTRDQVWEFLSNETYRGGRYFPHATMRRIDDGVASYDRTNQYGHVSSDGILFLRTVMRVTNDEERQPIVLVGEVVHPLVRLLHCSRRLYRSVGYRGPVTVDVIARNMWQQRMPFVAGTLIADIGDFRCFEETVAVTDSFDIHNTEETTLSIVQRMMRQFCWSFWQSDEPFPAAVLDLQLADLLRRLGVA